MLCTSGYIIFIKSFLLTDPDGDYHLNIFFDSMAARKSLTNTQTIEATPKKTSIGDGRRKRGLLQSPGSEAL